MNSSRIGIGALVIALGAYAGPGFADAGQTASTATHHEKTTATQHHDTKMGSHSASMKDRTVAGEVKAIDAKALTLANGEQFRIGNSTRFMNGDKKISLQDVKQGERVRASYEPRGKLAYAVRVDVVSMKGASKSSQTKNGQGR